MVSRLTGRIIMDAGMVLLALDVTCVEVLARRLSSSNKGNLSCLAAPEFEPLIFGIQIIQSNDQLRMDVYTFLELADMVMCYGEARGNGRRALHIYQQQFQNRNHPHHTMFARLYQRLRDDESLRPRRIGGRPRRHPLSIYHPSEFVAEVLTHSVLRVQFKMCHCLLHAVMWLADKPREFILPTLLQRRITYVPEKVPSKYGVHSEEPSVGFIIESGRVQVVQVCSKIRLKPQLTARHRRELVSRDYAGNTVHLLDGCGDYFAAKKYGGLVKLNSKEQLFMDCCEG
ncbi:hypothetical protein ANN_08176 [Periplaneta americana]|uniref:DUF4817 domain-containing protein n=1 Tax=Periplaneta americana TaxID=6978 RepID=A0ABQ8T293_PERAM|nr:hypothetical protein ANN_08176 [Periplaneta americana]